MKTKVKFGLVLTALLLPVLALTACQGAGGATVTQQLVKVERGDMTISVTGNGQIGTSREARLAFGSGGKVAEVLVKDGEEVKQGQVLALLDTGALEVAYAQAEVSLMQAETGLAQAKLSRQQAEVALQNARDSEDTLNAALLNAQVALDQARRVLNTSITAVDYRAAEANLRKAEQWYEYVLRAGRETGPGGDDWPLALKRAEDALDAARAAYDNALAGYDSEDITIKKNQVKAAELSHDAAMKNLEKLGDTIATQELQLEAATLAEDQAASSVDLARQSLTDAQRQLDEATITATFDGTAATVNAKAGDVVPSPTFSPQTIVYLVDLTQLELVVEVDEVDIPQVTVGAEAIITVDALPHEEFHGEVIAIYPVAREVGGVVLYDVRLSLDDVAGSAIRVGMSATADIQIASSPDTLIIPSRAITQNDQGQSVVTVQTGQDGKTREQVVTVGLTDTLRSEITSGLTEGETVVIEIRR